MNNPPLGKIRIAAPCNAEWKWMYGNDRVRFCGQCSQNVFNLSALTTEEAEDLIRRTEGTLCVRFYRRRDGSILTKNCHVGLQAIRDRLTSTRAHIIAAILGFLGYLGVLGLSNRPVMGRPVMGSPVMGGSLRDLRYYPVVPPGVLPVPYHRLVTQSEAVIRQRAIFKVIPMYYSTGRNRPHGIVTVRVTIDEDGTVASAESLNGNTPLKELAEEAARQWKFEPALVDGRPVKVESTLTFRIKN